MYQNRSLYRGTLIKTSLQTYMSNDLCLNVSDGACGEMIARKNKATTIVRAAKTKHTQHHNFPQLLLNLFPG